MAQPDLVFIDEIEEWPEAVRRAALQRGTGTVARIADPAPDPKEVIFEGKSMPRAPDAFDRDIKMSVNAGLLDEVIPGRDPTEEETEEALNRAEEFKESHEELFERLSEGPDAEYAMSRLNLSDAVSDRLTAVFKWVLQECAWAEEETLELPRLGEDASPEQRLAYLIVMQNALEQLNDETLGRLVLSHIATGKPPNSPEDAIATEIGKRLAPSFFRQEADQHE